MIYRVIIGVLALVASTLVLKHNVHMFQLNGYKNNEQIVWLRKHFRQQWILVFSIVLGTFNATICSNVLNVISIFTLVVTIFVYKALNRIYNKKKLVLTFRVKKMLVTIAVLVVASVLAAIRFSVERLNGVFVIIVGMQIISCVIANVLNYPIDYCMNRYYVNDAKKLLKTVPDLKVIGVTGSYGKTSVKYYLQKLLQRDYEVLITPESFNTPLGVVRTIRESLRSTHQIFICEMGARYVGDIKEICDIVHPDLGVITSIGPQHLETFGSIESVKATKFELADALPKGGMLFLNSDNSHVMEKVSEEDKYDNVIFFGLESEHGGYWAKDVSVSQNGTSFTLVAPDGQEQDFQMRLVGMHSVANVVCAIAVANSLGVSLSDLKVPVRQLQPVQHRMQLVKYGQVTVIDDAYNSNPVGSKAAVETLALFDGTKILITPGMVELGDEEFEYNSQFGRYAARCCDYILLVGAERIKAIMFGMLQEGFPKNRCRRFRKVEEALEYAYKIKTDDHKYVLLENDLPDNY